MKKTLFAFMVMAASVMLVACNKSQKNDGKAVEGNKAKSEVLASKSEKASASSDDPSGIASIRKAWTGKTIEIGAGDTPRIEHFGLAFCQEYPQCETNRVLGEYLMSPKDFKNDLYDVQDVEKNGYISCQMRTEITPHTDICYWNRQNSHKLFAAFMHWATEGGEEENLVVFYDYDPATDAMTPETELTNMVERRVKGYDSYEVELPNEGKDLLIHCYSYNEKEDNAEVDDINLKWNGMTFD